MSSAEFNLNSSIKLGWRYVLPQCISYPAELPPEIVDLGRVWSTWSRAGLHLEDGMYFDRAVKDAQKILGVKADGFLGASTWAKIAAKILEAATSMDEARLLVADAPLPLIDPNIIVRHGFMGTLGKGASEYKPKQFVILHWGGYNVASCRGVLKDRELVSHLLIEPALTAEGKLLVYQVLDLARMGAHAGNPGNIASVGIDICHPAAAENAHRAPGKPTPLPNLTGRGDPTFVPIPKELGARVWALCTEVARLLEVPISPVYPGHKLIADPKPGILGHHHIKATKWDVAPWADVIWPR